MIRRTHLTVAAAFLALLGGACSDASSGPDPVDLGITSTLETTSTSTITTSTTQAPTTTRATVKPIRIEPGDLPPTRYVTDEFVYGFEFELPNGSWSTDEEGRTAIHLAQSPEPDFGAAASYDFPLLVLLALPELDDAAVVEIVQSLDDIGFVTATETLVDGRPTVTADGASRGNPFVTDLSAEDGTPFAGLGGYWFWDPDITAVQYRIWVIDMSRGTLLAWFAAPRTAFDAGVAAAAAVVDSIDFTD